MARAFQKGCLEEKVPPEILDVECWEVTEERTLGAGNKTIEMAQVQFLQQIRKNLGPEAQRKVDHISIVSALDDAALAEDLAPVEGQQQLSRSMHDAQLATDRLMRGLIFVPAPDMVYEDYVKVWLTDLSQMVQEAVKSGGMASAQDILGWQNMQKTIMAFLEIMAQDTDEKEKVRGYAQALSQEMNFVKAFTQRLQQKIQAQQKNGQQGNPLAIKQAEAALDLQTQAKKDQLKLTNMEKSHSQRTAQRQVQFELEQQREDRRANADNRRKGQEHALDITANRLKAFQE
jgi:hypothetical protein